jgi:hypothetical protein
VCVGVCVCVLPVEFGLSLLIFLFVTLPTASAYYLNKVRTNVYIFSEPRTGFSKQMVSLSLSSCADVDLIASDLLDKVF